MFLVPPRQVSPVRSLGGGVPCASVPPPCDPPATRTRVRVSRSTPPRPMTVRTTFPLGLIYRPRIDRLVVPGLQRSQQQTSSTRTVGPPPPTVSPPQWAPPMARRRRQEARNGR